MKINSKTLIGFFIAIFIVLILMFWMNKRKEIEHKSKQTSIKNTNSKPITPLKSKQKLEEKDYLFILKPELSKEITFQLDGKLDSYNWKKGDSFKKDDVLFQLNNEALFEQISIAKGKLKIDLLPILEQIEGSKNLWQEFYSNITDTDLLPKPPAEPNFNPEILKQIRQIQQMEQEIFSYFYLAPFDGEFTEVKIVKKIKKGKIIAQISTSKNVLLQTQISKSEKKNIQNLTDFIIKETKQNLKLHFQFKSLKNTDSLLVFSKIKKSILQKLHFGDSVTLIPIQKN